MADDTTQPESQKQRWLKYGSNVAITSLIVIALAVLVVYLAQSARRRVDTTTAGQYSLKPQTLNIIRDLKKPVRLISLYSAPTPEDFRARSGTESDAVRRARADAATERRMRAEAVADLLQEYARGSDKIKAESIDPLADPSRVDKLVTEVAEQYGGEVKKYREFIEMFPATYEKIDAAAKAEVTRISALPLDTMQSQQAAEGVLLAIVTVQGLPSQLKADKEAIDGQKDQKPPDYKGATDSITKSMTTMSTMLGGVISNFEQSRNAAEVSKEIRAYMSESLPRYKELKKLADDVLSEAKGLGELKLDTLRQSLKASDSVLVLGEDDIRVLTADQVWKSNPDRRALGPGGQINKPEFAGQQQITTAILSLTEKPKKVVFVRPGGSPLCSPGMPPFQIGGPFSAIANRLREYNFEVLEKDLSGTYAMQAQMRGGRADPEPSDEQIKDAIWIVLNFPPGQNPMGLPPATIGAKVHEHLDNGGSALVLSTLQADGLADALKDWGVSIDTGKIIVHDSAPSGAPESGDPIEEAKKVPYIFVLNNAGDHLLTAPWRSLDGIFLGLVPVKTEAKQGVKLTPILPIPTDPKAWAESDAESAASREGTPPTFDASKGDAPGPLYAGAVAEREGKGRLVVVGGLDFMANNFVNILDKDLAARQVYAARFPANSELVTNSVFWLAKLDPMIAISPTAMEVSRIGPISPGMLSFWRVGVLLIGLPVLVVLAGAGVYLSRRD
jgi:hypothetical protein